MNKQAYPVLIITRAFRELPLKDIETFLDTALPLGQIVVVCKKSYKFREELKALVREKNKEGNVTVLDSNTDESACPAEMCNEAILFCKEKDIEYFVLVSNDLVGNLPIRLPTMLDLLRQEKELASVGLAIKGVHNMELLNEIERGEEKVTPSNFANIFYNNAFSVNRLLPLVKSVSISADNRFFPQEVDKEQEIFGVASRKGRDVPLGGNEEMALAMKLLKKGKPLKLILLAGDYTIARNHQKATSSIDKDDKVWRRKPTAKKYQEHFNVSDEMLQKYLDDYYEIKYKSKA